MKNETPHLRSFQTLLIIIFSNIHSSPFFFMPLRRFHHLYLLIVYCTTLPCPVPALLHPSIASPRPATPSRQEWWFKGPDGDLPGECGEDVVFGGFG